METLNDRIRNLRKEKNLTKAELAQLLNVTDKAVSKWETGDSNPDIVLLPKLAEVYCVTLDYLLTGKKEEKISLDDMDSEKKMHYLIKNDDSLNFIKYEYCNISSAFNRSRINRNGNIYYGQQVKFDNSELPILNISVWKEIIDENANDIFNVCCDSLLSQVRDNLSIAVLLVEILDDFIKKCIELDRDDVLKALGVRYFEIGVNEIKSIGRRTSFYIPNIYSGNNEKKNIFYISNETLEYFFKNALKSPKCFAYITELEIKIKERFEGRLMNFYTCTYLYNEIINLAIKYEKYDLINNYLMEFKKELEYFNSIKDIHDNGFLNFFGGFIRNEYSSIYARVFNISEDSIKEAIKLGKIELAKELNCFNKSIVDSLKTLKFYRYKSIDFIYAILEGEIEKLAKLNNQNLNENEKLKLEAVNNYIINLEVLKKSRNIKLIREILNNNFYNYYEFAYESMKNKKVRELFKFFVDNEFDNLAVDLMKGEKYYSIILSNVWKIFSSAPGYSGYEENMKLINSQNKTGLELKSLYDSSCQYNSYEVKSKNSIPYIDVFERKYGKVDQYVDQLGDNPIIDRIKELKEEIYDEVVNIVAKETKVKEDKIAKEKIAKGLTKEYLKNLLDNEDTELFIIKLCALQDAIFMYDYHYEGENYSERLESHFNDLEEKAPKSCKCDDGWGYMVLDTEWEENKVIPAQERISHLRNLFHRLRVSRNNIAHGTKENINELSLDELNECLEYVFLIKKEEE